MWLFTPKSVVICVIMWLVRIMMGLVGIVMSILMHRCVMKIVWSSHVWKILWMVCITVVCLIWIVLNHMGVVWSKRRITVMVSIWHVTVALVINTVRIESMVWFIVLSNMGVRGCDVRIVVGGVMCCK